MPKPLYIYDLTHTVSQPRDNARQLRRIWDETHLVTSMQGIVNRREPRLYLILVGGADGRTERNVKEK